MYSVFARFEGHDRNQYYYFSSCSSQDSEKIKKLSNKQYFRQFKGRLGINCRQMSERGKIYELNIGKHYTSDGWILLIKSSIQKNNILNRKQCKPLVKSVVNVCY